MKFLIFMGQKFTKDLRFYPHNYLDKLIKIFKNFLR